MSMRPTKKTNARSPQLRKLLRDKKFRRLRGVLRQEKFRIKILPNGSALVWWKTPEGEEVVVGYIKPSETCFCFDWDHRSDEGIMAVRAIVDTLKTRGVIITTSPMTNFRLPESDDARQKDTVTAG